MTAPTPEQMRALADEPPQFGDIVTRGNGRTEYRVWCVDGDIAFVTSNSGIPRRVALSSLRYVRSDERSIEMQAVVV